MKSELLIPEVALPESVKAFYRVKWTSNDGRYVHLDFFTRNGAIKFINRLVLDHGIADAKLSRKKVK